jgi:uncharacterized membrane protein YciS (DUF1049 family)
VWVIKGILFLAVLFALVYFFVSNSGQVVDINFFGKSYLGISIYWVVVISFLVGFATSFILAAFREFRFHREIGQLKRQAGAKDREIADLRTLPLKSMETGDTDSVKAGEVSSD